MPAPPLPGFVSQATAVIYNLHRNQPFPNISTFPLKYKLFPMKYSFASVFSSSLLTSHLSSIILRHFPHRFAVSASLPLLLVIGSTSDCLAQNFGHGNGTSTFSPTFLSPAQSYTLDSGITCPTTSISVTGFGGTANDFANARSNFTSNSGANNYGAAVSLNIPLGGRYAEFCKDFAETQTLDLRKRLKITESQFQSQLVQQCYYLLSIHIDFDNEYYNEDAPGSALFPCRDIVKTINPPDSSPISGPGKPPEFSEPAPLRPRPMLTEPIR